MTHSNKFHVTLRCFAIGTSYAFGMRKRKEQSDISRNDGRQGTYDRFSERSLMVVKLPFSSLHLKTSILSFVT